MAETAKHTSGTWLVGGPRTGPTTASIYGPTVAGRGWLCEHVTCNLETIAIVPRQVDGTLEANAHLIAAAPELLALAVQYRDDLHHPPSPDSRERRLAAIEAVLAKVEPRP